MSSKVDTPLMNAVRTFITWTNHVEMSKKIIKTVQQYLYSKKEQNGSKQKEAHLDCIASYIKKEMIKNPLDKVQKMAAKNTRKMAEMSWAKTAALNELESIKSKYEELNIAHNQLKVEHESLSNKYRNQQKEKEALEEKCISLEVREGTILQSLRDDIKQMRAMEAVIHGLRSEISMLKNHNEENKMVKDMKHNGKIMEEMHCQINAMGKQLRDLRNKDYENKKVIFKKDGLIQRMESELRILREQRKKYDKDNDDEKAMDKARQLPYPLENKYQNLMKNSYCVDPARIAFAVDHELVNEIKALLNYQNKYDHWGNEINPTFDELLKQMKKEHIFYYKFGMCPSCIDGGGGPEGRDCGDPVCCNHVRERFFQLKKIRNDVIHYTEKAKEYKPDIVSNLIGTVMQRMEYLKEMQ